MRIAIMGSGGLGGYYGGVLAKAGEDVTFIARGAHLDAIRSQGLKIKSPDGGEFTIKAEATDDPGKLDPVDLVMFCVKTYDTDAAAEQIRPIVGPDTVVTSIQNGIDSARTHHRGCELRQLRNREARSGRFQVRWHDFFWRA